MLISNKPPRVHYLVSDGLVAENPRLGVVIAVSEMVPQAARLFVEKYGEEPLNESRQRRREHLPVYLAAGEFQKRRTPFARLGKPLQSDIKAFFGHYAGACDEARELLFASENPTRSNPIPSPDPVGLTSSPFFSLDKASAYSYFVNRAASPIKIKFKQILE